MVVMLLAFLGIAGCVVLITLGLAPDPAEHVIRRRLNSEMAVAAVDNDEPTQKRGYFVRLLDAMAPVNRSPRLDKVKQHLGRHLVSGHVQLSAIEFLGCQELLAIAAVAGYICWARPHVNWIIVIIAGSLGFLLPDMWLRQHIKQRQNLIARDLPEVVDLLSLCVDAGTDFMGAMQRVVKEFRMCPLIEELSMVLQEVRVGKRRRDALRSLARRVPMSEIGSFVRTLVQADRMGTGIGEALRIHSEEARLRRYHRGDRMAQQAPMKMLIPLIFCIMPTVAIIVGGPILLQFMNGSLIPKM